ncbi:MAG: hypothetical protein ACXAEF_02550, partial [Candidatus Thorarchaeota archaeon]
HMEERSHQFHNRPFNVAWGFDFVTIIRDTIKDSKVLELPKYLGSVDQFSDSTDLVCKVPLKQRIKNVYYQ